MTQTRIIVTESCNENSRFATVIELVMDTPHWEDGTFILVKSSIELSGDPFFFLNKARLNVPSRCDHQELGSSRMRMRCIHAAWMEEVDRCSDSKTNQSWEVLGSTPDLLLLVLPSGFGLTAMLKLYLKYASDGP